MGLFFIDSERGTVATQRQLIDAGIADEQGIVPRPWLRMQGPGDASTMWYAVLRKRERGVFIGNLVLRHTAHHDLLLGRGWEEVAVADIGPGAAAPEADEA